jgi:valyl-tRNA synthetase
MSREPWDATFDHQSLEAECRASWEAEGVHRFDPDGDGEIFAVDTPPPYVSAQHLHVGHAMSYTQAESVVRYQRMCGRRVFYPMGFDDNGLPTERHVEQVRGLDRRTTSRAAFRAACLEETARGAETYEALWRALGLSVDWSLGYSTIDTHCRRTAQWSFLELLRQDRIRRGTEPVAWDPVSRTALAQTDLESVSRRQKLHAVSFRSPDGRDLPIATTRPELLPACVALYRHPDDARWQGVATALVPLDDRAVPVLAEAAVRPDFGTGLVMVCTFGDHEDVRRWRRDGLDTRIVIGEDGRLTAGPHRGRTVPEARAGTVAALAAVGLTSGFTMTEQVVPVAERSGAEIELLPVPQWFVRVIDLRDRLLARSAELRWHPAWMKERLDRWILGVDRDWNLSRQRFYGVPFPVWFCTSCDTPVFARIEDLPVDPLEDAPPVSACPSCGGALRGDPDVMDTWMTSSLTPQITSNRVNTPRRTGGPFPLTVRVQAFEIVRSWLYTTLVKAELHDGSLPFRDVMISGWGLDEQGHKISKRNLAPPKEGELARYEPGAVIAAYGADALRHWAASARLGHDQRFTLADVRAGRKVAVKVWNAGRLAATFPPSGAAPAWADRPPEDRDLFAGLDAVIATVREAFQGYDGAVGLAAVDAWFFGTFCDDWLETVKERLRRPERFGPASDAAGRATLDEAYRTVLGLYAPFLPFVTEAAWQRSYRAREGGTSLHRTTFPSPLGVAAEPEMDLVRAVLGVCRGERTRLRLPQSREAAVTFDADAPTSSRLRALELTVLAACRASSFEDGPGVLDVPGYDLRLVLTF